MGVGGLGGATRFFGPFLPTAFLVKKVSISSKMLIYYELFILGFQDTPFPK